MGQVTVTINQRDYTIGCGDGEEDHLLTLAQYLDRHVADLVRTVGQVGDSRLMLMAGLTIADELSEMTAKAQALEKKLAEIAQSSESVGARAEAAETKAAETIENAAARIDEIAERLSVT
jgi:cell division protein ZapA